MSQNPYATTYGGIGETAAPPARTSLLAILSLVSSLICCIPVVTGALGAILGGIAVVRIGASNGRRKGVGLAIAGIVIGLITSIIWLFVAIGAYQGMKQFTQMTQPLVDSFRTADATALRGALNPTLSAQVSDADFRAFREKVEGEIGTLAIPTNPLEFFGGYGKAGQLMEKIPNNQGDLIPVPLKGTKGYAMLLIKMPRNGSGSATNMTEALLGNASNIGVILPSGEIVYLVDPKLLPSTPSPADRALPGPDDAPAVPAPPANPNGV